MAKQPQLAIVTSTQYEECGGDRLMELGQRHKAGEIYLLNLEAGTYFGCQRRWLWRVGYLLLKAAADAVLDTKPVLMQEEMF